MDPRFDTANDPRFKRLAAKKRKIVLDERFKDLENDPATAGVLIDPRSGARKKKAGVLLKKYVYREENNKKQDVEEESETNDGIASTDDESRFSWHQESDSSDDDEEINDEKKDRQDADSPLEDPTGSIWNTYEEDIPMGSETSRLAVMGCDWDVITSRDLFVLLSSFLGSATYLSDFGAERVQEEALHGPRLDLPKVEVKPGETAEADDSSSDEENEDGGDDKKHEEQDEAVVAALRKYQKERSRYYYAVVECDSKDTASTLYDQLEGVDCDFAIDGLDVRFIPDDLPPFTNTHPRAPRCEANGLPSKGYQPPACLVSALRHSKVKYTWDETPASRARTLRRTFTAEELAGLDLDDYLASESEGDYGHTITLDDIELPAQLKRSETTEEPDPTPLDDIAAYRRLLLGEPFVNEDKSNDLATVQREKNRTKIVDSKQPNEEEEIEFTWRAGGDAENASLQGSSDDDTDRREEQQRLAPWEAYLEKRKLKKKQRKQEWREKQRRMETEKETLKVSSKKTKAFPLVGKNDQDVIVDADSRKRQAELELLALGNEASDDDDVEDKAKKQSKKLKKTKKSSSITPSINLDDERFAELFTNQEMAVDVTHPRFKKSETYKAFLMEKAKRKRRHVG